VPIVETTRSMLHGALPLGARHAAAEVLLRDDVRGRLRPELRELDAALLERRAVLSRDERVALLPLDLVVRVATLDREQPANRDAGVLVDDAVSELVGMDLNGALLLYGRHVSPPPRALSGARTSLVPFLKGDGP
jgi:hypothetical protein